MISPYSTLICQISRVAVQKERKTEKWGTDHGIVAKYRHKFTMSKYYLVMNTIHRIYLFLVVVDKIFIHKQLA